MLKGLMPIRKHCGLSRKDVADQLEVPWKTYRNWEQCVSAPRDNETLLHIMTFFGCTADELIFGAQKSKERMQMPNHTSENKRLFFDALKVAFMAGDHERYHSALWAVEYRAEDGQEWLCDYSVIPSKRVNVTGCSCSAIATALVENFL